MQYYICEGQIVGIHPEGVESYPANFTLSNPTEIEEQNLELLYLDENDTVHYKPERPSLEAYWSLEQRKWLDPGTAIPLTLEDAIAQQRAAAGQYWNARIEGLTSTYPAPEVSSWTELKAQATKFLESHDLTVAENLYHEIMLRQFGAEATPEYCEQFWQAMPEDAVQLTTAFAHIILQNGERLITELTRLKGLRGFHWEQIGKLETIATVQNYDFSVE